MLKLRALVIVVAWGFLTAIPAHAQDTRTAARELVKKWQAAIVNVRVVVKMRMSMAGREMQSSDDTIEIGRASCRERVLVTV